MSVGFLLMLCWGGPIVAFATFVRVLDVIDAKTAKRRKIAEDRLIEFMEV